MRIITFNIQRCVEKEWVKKRDYLCELISQKSPDILCLQEVRSSGLKYLVSKLEPIYVLGRGRDDGKDKGEFAPIITFNNNLKPINSGVFWLSPTPDIPSKGWNALCKRICSWILFHDLTLKNKLLILNAHLDHFSNLARTKSTELVIKKVLNHPEAKNNFIIAGDWNASEKSNAYCLIRNNSDLFVEDSFYSTRHKYDKTIDYTWEGVSKFGLWRNRIDYIFHGRNINIDKYKAAPSKVDSIKISDHKHVIVDFNYSKEVLENQ